MTSSMSSALKKHAPQIPLRALCVMLPMLATMAAQAAPKYDPGADDKTIRIGTTARSAAR